MKLRRLAIIFALALAASMAIPLHAAETVHLYLKLNGAQIKGESMQKSLGREDSIECLYYEQSMVSTPRTSAASRNSGVQYNSIIIRKRIDKASPLLISGITQNQQAEGFFRFYRPSPNGDGTTEQFYTVQFSGGHIDAIRQYVPDTVTPATATQPPMEEITISYTTITFTYTNGGVTATGTAH